ncbi:hypothetical protein [Streptomyces paradoxus]|uniref:Secreted protein/lipoprotein n=1 Tax=Streptomyces paradoxus TaxID=66375 RepID=A0A7W9THX9_9ACTN|nr:hypothetical protein [Streptomyces paradoxus]MBB6081045.1 hypothetical protein [Streptomyces paradoxus]
MAAVAVTLSAILAQSACSSSDGKDEAADVSPSIAQSPTSSAPADPKETAKKEAVTAYGAYWQQMEKLYADPTGKAAHLDQYAASAALKNAEADAKRAHDRGRIYTGGVALTDQTVTKVNVSGKIPNATVSSCLDISKWRKVDAKTKKPVSLPKNRLTKYRILSTVEKYPEGWRVTRDDPQGKSC